MFVSSEEVPSAPDGLAVGLDLPVRAEAGDDVPVERRAVEASRLREADAERDVDRPADLLVEERVPGVTVDAVVEPDGRLAEDAGAVVHREERTEMLLPRPRLGVHDAALLEAQADALDLLAGELSRHRERDLSPCRGLDRRGEDLAARHVVR